MQNVIENIAVTTGQAVGLVCDGTATPGERWCATIGLDSSGVGPTPDMAMRAAYLDWDMLGSPTVEVRA